jgi:hypothetical protein
MTADAPGPPIRARARIAPMAEVATAEALLADAYGLGRRLAAAWLDGGTNDGVYIAVEPRASA